MKFTFYHNNINVADLDKSIEFYKKALGLKITKETEAADGSFKLVFMGDDTTPHKLELTWLRDMDRPYDLGDNEIHLAMQTDDMDAALAFHKEMDCVCFETRRWVSILSMIRMGIGWKFARRNKLNWDLIQEGCGYPNRNKAWKGVPAQVPSAGQF